jgi:hypothetical protein
MGGDALINSETLLLTDFINLKIKSTQFFRCAYRDKLCENIFIKINDYMYKYLIQCLAAAGELGVHLRGLHIIGSEPDNRLPAYLVAPQSSTCPTC